MDRDDSIQLSRQIIGQAMSLGASLAGTASIDGLRRTPSHRTAKAVRWPHGAKSVIVLALHHPDQDAALDWWDNRAGRTPGNRALIRVSERLGQWLQEELAITSFPAAYDIKKSGVYLKDAAVLAGLGIIGRNNLLVTPQFGTRVRLRALLTDIDLEKVDPLPFSPCVRCPAPCLQVCPQKALQDGRFERQRCYRQLQKNENDPHRIIDPSSMSYSIVCIKYCRACELACPVSA
jgi:epoxyqueuosine reductase